MSITSISNLRPLTINKRAQEPIISKSDENHLIRIILKIHDKRQIIDQFFKKLTNINRIF
jgi:hypothetical protein